MKRQIGLWVASLACCHGQMFRGGVECAMDDSDLSFIVPGEEVGSWEVPISVLSLTGATLVRHCWCASLMQEEEAYCPPETDTCIVSVGQRAMCSVDSMQLTVARAVWPFALFLMVTFIYLLVASRAGRLARGYLRRQFVNVQGCICNSMSRERHGVQVEEVRRIDDTISVDRLSSRTIQRDGEQNVLRLAVHENGADSNFQQAAQTVAEASPAPILPTNYPVEIFGRQSNFNQLFQELLRMRETRQHEQVAYLWYLAWTRERQEMLRLERRGRIRSWLGGENASIPTIERPWWDNRRTLRLELKTKRFQSSLVAFGGMLLQAGQIRETGTSSSGRMDEDVTDFEGDTPSDGNQEAADENTCAICLCRLEDGDFVGDIPCKHLFHKVCLKSWLTRSNRCPLCQKDVLQIHGGSIAEIPNVGDNPDEGE